MPSAGAADRLTVAEHQQTAVVVTHELGLDIEPLFGQQRLQADDILLDDLVDVENRLVDLLRAFQHGALEHGVDKRLQAQHLLLDDLQVVRRPIWRNRPVEHAFDKAPDGGDWGTQVV